MPERYMITASGKRVDVPDPKPGQICIEDIATHLSRLPRFVGAAKRPYSVAQHSITVAYVAVAIAQHQKLQYQVQGSKADLIREGLLHDAAEFITGDCPSPVKAAIGPSYKSVSKSIEAGIRKEFKLATTEPHVVWQADKIMLALEARELCNGDLDLQYVPQALQDLMQHIDNDWWDAALEILPEHWDAETSYKAFMREWELCNG